MIAAVRQPELQAAKGGIESDEAQVLIDRCDQIVLIFNQQRGKYEAAYARAMIDRCQRLIRLADWLGPLTASALTASIANGHEFANGRQFAAWLGRVPRRIPWWQSTFGSNYQARRCLSAH